MIELSADEQTEVTFMVEQGGVSRENAIVMVVSQRPLPDDVVFETKEGKLQWTWQGPDGLHGSAIDLTETMTEERARKLLTTDAKMTVAQVRAQVSPKSGA